MTVKLSDAQRRVLVSMVGAPLRKTPQGWFAKGTRACAEATRFKLIDLEMIEPVKGIDRAFELTEEGFQEATRR